MYQVIIADDEPIIREGIGKFINWAAMDCEIVLAASNGKEVIEFMRTSHADILITDIRMPGLSGLEVIHKIKEAGFLCKTIIISGYSDFHYAQEALQLGVVDFILKDNPLEKIESATKKAIIQIEKELLHRKELRSKFFQDLTHRTILTKEETEHKTTFLCNDLDGYYCAVFYAASNNPKYTQTETQSQKLLYSVSNFLSMSLQPYVYSSFAAQTNNLCFVLSGKNISEEALCEKFDYLFQLSGQMIGHLLLKTGVSSFHNGLSTFYTAYEEALSALNALKPQEQISFYSAPVPGLPANESICRAIKYIQSNYMDDLSLNIVAKQVGLNASYLSRIFKKEIKKSLTEYITYYRIQKAKELLLAKDYKLIQISEKVGFHDTGYFSNTFKKVTGYSPTEYRILHNKH